ncbi:MAG: ABC transporter permease [Planctomycetota bacterium]|jgi:ribose transport system permease protein/AI-2 transport system permease protein|nr:ABC transporter permease [Planctomycetota bacterium]
MGITERIRVFKPRIGRRELFTLFLLALEVVVFSLVADHFLSYRNVLNILRNSVDLAVVAIGMTIIMIICGIDLSVGSALGVVAILVGWMLNAGVNPFFIAGVAVAAGCAIGLVNGFLICFLRIPDIVATIGTQSILRAMVFFMLGGQWLTGLPPVYGFLTRGRVWGVPVSLLVIAVFYAAFWYFLTRRPAGRRIYAVGNGLETAKLVGISARRVRTLSYVLCGGLVGFAALLYVGRLGSVEITVGNDLALSAIAATVIGGTAVTGGRGSVVGTLAGVFFMSVMKNGIVLFGIPSLWERAAVGLMIVVSIKVDLMLEKRTLRRQQQQLSKQRESAWAARRGEGAAS